MLLALQASAFAHLGMLYGIERVDCFQGIGFAHSLLVVSK